MAKRKSEKNNSKVLAKKEFRMDLNPKHQGRRHEPHPAVITAKKGNSLKANTISHSKYTQKGVPLKPIKENPNKNNWNPDDKKQQRLHGSVYISKPFWQKREDFSKKLKNHHWSDKTFKTVRNFNKKCERDYEKNLPKNSNKKRAQFRVTSLSNNGRQAAKPNSNIIIRQDNKKSQEKRKDGQQMKSVKESNFRHKKRQPLERPLKTSQRLSCKDNKSKSKKSQAPKGGKRK